MAIDIKLDSNTHDIDISKGITFNSDSSDSLAQKVKIALLLRAGEWPSNVNVGVPYSQSILSGKNNKTFTDSYLQGYILRIPEVGTLKSFSSEVTSDRRYVMKFSAAKDQDAAEIEVTL